MADEVAKKAAEMTGIRAYSERFTFLAHIRCTVTEKNWKVAKCWF